MPNIPQSIRLTFSYEGGEIKLERSRKIAMRAPVTPAPKGVREDEIAGHYIEVVDRDKKRLFHRWVEAFIPESVEVPTGDPDEPFRRYPNELKRGTFHVVVPDLDDAEELVLGESTGVGSAPKGKRARAQKKDIHRVNLRAIREEGGGDERQ